MKKIVTFCFTSEEARKIYNNKPPQYETPFASGFDLRVCSTHNDYDCDYIFDGDQNNICLQQGVCNTILSHKRMLIKTGIRISIPIIKNEITELQIRSRSGLALKNGIIVLNGIGTIDNDYRGELGVILYNTSRPFEIKLGDRIAQGVLNPLTQCIFQEVSEYDFNNTFCNTKRGDGGFGSTGI